MGNSDREAGNADRPVEYAELSAFTNYSFLHGGSAPEEMAEAAIEHGHAAIAITDRHGVYGMPKMWGKLRESGTSTKLLVGGQLPLAIRENDVYGPETPNVNLIARDRAAYGALCRIFTEAHRFQPKGQSLLSASQFLDLLRTVPGADGLLLFPQWEETFDRFPEDVFEPLVAELSWISSWKKENVFLPLSRMIDGRDVPRTAMADRLSAHFGIPLVAHNRVLYHHPERRRVLDTLSCIREGKTLKESGTLLKRNEEAYLKPPSVMRALFHDRPELIECGLSIARSCTFVPSELRYRYPSEWIPAGHTAQTYLASLCEAGKATRYPRGIPPAVETQLRHELALIDSLGYADYFLTVYDIVDFARREGILCQGRGSAANSVVCYVTGVTAIDPVEMNLLFERFISAERGEPPDIDVDFEHDRREEVIQYIYQKYGRERAAMVSAVSMYRSRSAIRETAKVFGVPVGTVSARKVEKMVEDPAIVEPRLAAKIRRIAGEIEDFPRHLSIHSGGFTLSADPLIEIVPIEPATMEDRTIVQWDKYDLDILGLLKIDVLALGMLSALQRGLKLVGRELYQIPQNDPRTYDMICRADTIGTFQVESRAQMAMLPRLRPRNLYDLVIQVAIVRPGPIVGKMVHPYLKRRRGQEEWKLPHPALEPILARTFGVPIFQEQVMKMAIALADFTPGEADQLRKAIGAWRSSGSIDAMGRKLKDGLMRKGIPEEFSQRIFEQIHGFAEYGFPESHAASFALLAYASCWLKEHHPAEFLVAMLNSQPLGFYAPHTLVGDAKRHGVAVLPVSIVESDWETKLVSAPGAGGAPGKAVRLGFHQVHGISEAEGRRIVEARAEAPFLGFQDFVTRVSDEVRGRSPFRRQVLRMLAVGDAFRDFGINQRQALWKALAFETMVAAPLFRTEVVQAELFSETAFAPMDGYEEVLSDYRATGLSARGHPMEWVRKKVAGKIPDMDSARARALPNGRVITIPGLSLVLQRPPTAKGTAFATLEDEFGLLDLVLHREVFQAVRQTMLEEPFVIVKGTIQRDGLAVNMIVHEVRPFLPATAGEMSPSFEPGAGSMTQVRIPDAPGAFARR